MNSKFSKYLCFFALAGLMLAGCGGSEVPTLSDMNKTNIMRLHSCYQIYLNNNRMKGPKSEKDLKEHFATNNTAKVLLERMGIAQEEFDDIFISERDGQPFKVRYGINGIADHAIIFEAEGVEGLRMVAFAKPRELEASDYEGYLSGKIKPEAPGAIEDFEPDKELGNKEE